MNPRERERFDALLEEALDNLPPRLHALLEEVPLVVDDRPEASLARELYEELGHEEGETVEDFAASLCGLHTGVPLTEQSVTQSGEMPTSIRLFREGIVETAGGWEVGPEETDEEVDDTVYEEIMITLLHEIGHHFGLKERDLEELGYD
ncbi:MAG: metallopeptidase family protein [Phycisphaerae bacterium]|nr:metallopeptidase family protein [Phycisphaerae bacterium]